MIENGAVCSCIVVYTAWGCTPTESEFPNMHTRRDSSCAYLESISFETVFFYG